MTETITERPPVGQGFEVDHYYCCDKDKALCGADLRGQTEVYTILPHKLCTVCHHLDQHRCKECGQ